MGRRRRPPREPHPSPRRTGLGAAARWDRGVLVVVQRVSPVLAEVAELRGPVEQRGQQAPAHERHDHRGGYARARLHGRARGGLRPCPCARGGGGRVAAMARRLSRPGWDASADMGSGTLPFPPGRDPERIWRTTGDAGMVDPGQQNAAPLIEEGGVYRGFSRGRGPDARAAGFATSRRWWPRARPGRPRGVPPGRGTASRTRSPGRSSRTCGSMPGRHRAPRRSRP